MGKLADKAAAAVEEQVEDPRLTELKAANSRLSRDLVRTKAKTELLVAAVYQAARDACSGLTIPPVPPPPKETRRKVAETAIAVLADWQLAKVTKSYSTEVCERRIEDYAEKVIALTDIQRADHPVKDCRVYLLGDLVEGELIFPGQQHLIDASLYRQVTVDGPRILGNFLRRMAAHFENVHVVGVIGNHGSLGGRARKDYHPESNADAMMYEITRLITESEGRITWAPNSTPGERHWYAVDHVGDKGFFLFHGDQVKGGFAGIPWYGFSKKIMGWALMEGMAFDYALAGHYHTPTRMLIADRYLWVSGSTESSNTYAAEMLAAQGTPSQWLLFCHPERGVTAEYQCHLT